MSGAAVQTAAFADRLISWQQVHGRHDLPWQGTRDPYLIWLSEIMLQQTQVGTVIPYFVRFVGRFPDVQSLAQASLDDVLTLWSGLGYYSRARHLHRAAGIICTAHAGRFPQSHDAVLALPGIGRSTAAAICAFAWGERRAILDGNVKRVLARHAGIEGWPGQPAVEAALWQVAQARLPAEGAVAPAGRTAIAVHTQALMDLGAGVCARSRPRCADCPVAGDCAARLTGRLSSIPAPRPRKAMPHRTSAVWVMLDASGCVLLEQRPPTGIWGGLWSLPESLGVAADVHIHADGQIERLPPVEHAFTHFRLTIEPMLVRTCIRGGPMAERSASPPVAAEPGRRWMPLDELGSIALPAPVRTLLESLR